MRRQIKQGTPGEKVASFSRAIVDGDMIYVSGTVGFDEGTRTLPEDVVEQTKNSFRIIEWALAEAGASLADTVRVRIFYGNAADYPKVSPIIAEKFRGIDPANTTVVTPLIDPGAKIEIEVTARKR
jgi:enamine deaminase RidA (YjgF/YER057c/UK114 family)